MSGELGRYRLSRRRFLGLGAGAAGLALVPGLAIPALGPRRVLAAETLVEPPVRMSDQGLLETTLTAQHGPAWLNGSPAQLTVYDGSYPGPTLRVRAGDVLRVRLVNNLDNLTNLHVHGFHVSPLGNGDNVFLHLMAGATLDFEFALPADHPARTYRYHPHFHGDSEEQVYGGLAGAIIIEGDLDQVPGIAGLPERLLVFHATEVDQDNVLVPFAQSEHDKLIRTVNGQLNPIISIRPGETQRWRVANIAADTFFRVALDGHVLYQISKDGNTFPETYATDAIVLPPGARAEFLVVGGPPGDYAFRTLEVSTGLDSSEPEVVLATVVSAGKPVRTSPLPTTLLPMVDLRRARIDQRRELTFNYGPGHDFVAEIDGRPFDENRVDQVALLGATEEWVINNATDDWHPFHIHINDFMTVAENGQPIPVLSHEDTRAVPPHGSITIRTQFRDFPGRWVYHCHILGHEDAGMMGVIEVQEPGIWPASSQSEGYSCRLDDGMGGRV